MIEKEVSISELKKLLKDGIKFEIDTPDGWQNVNYYIDKGEKDIYLAECQGEITRSAAKHLYETQNGWMYAKDMVNKDCKVLCSDGEYHHCVVTKAHYKEKVVDISIDHENQRYFTNNISSHNTGVGKTGFMAHYAAEMATQGYNVLYVSMEMAEERIAQRMDANLLDTTMDDLEKLEVIQFADKINRLKKKGLGKIIIKEYPTASAHMGHIEALLRELKMKKGFVPDIVCLDYLNICLSRRVSLNKGSYLFVKSIAEEFRGLAGKYNFVGVTAVQGNRGTIESSDIGMQDTGESKGINDTVDFMLGMMAPEEIAEQGLMLCKQLKSRYDNIHVPGKKRFMLTYNREKMWFGEAEDVDHLSAYIDPHKAKDKSEDEDKPLFDQSTADRFLEEAKGKKGSNQFKINF